MGNKPKGVKKPRPKPGMPQKLTKEVKDKIIDAIRCGVYIETAAAVAGITRQTFYNWLRRGKEEKRGKFHDFVKEVNIAFAEVTRNDMEVIGLAGERDWKPRRGGSRSGTSCIAIRAAQTRSGARTIRSSSSSRV